MTLWLLRHGSTEDTEAHRYCGASDPPLSPSGREALQALRYNAPAGARFLTSGMRRCAETLELLFGPVPYESDPDLRELDFGAFEGSTYEQLQSNPAYQRWITGDNDANIPPGGESGNAMATRVLAALQRMLLDGRDTVAVVHGGTIAVVMEALFPQERRNRWQWQPRCGAGYVLTFTGTGPTWAPWTPDGSEPTAE